MKILTFLCVLGLILPLQTQAADTEGNYAVWGIGLKSCFRYTQAREKDDYDNYTNYIKGFLTSFNMLSAETYNITGGKPFNELLEWIDDYCETQPIHALEQGLLEMIDAHQEKRTKKPSSGVSR